MVNKILFEAIVFENKFSSKIYFQKQYFFKNTIFLQKHENHVFDERNKIVNEIIFEEILFSKTNFLRKHIFENNISSKT